MNNKHNFLLTTIFVAIFAAACSSARDERNGAAALNANSNAAANSNQTSQANSSKTAIADVTNSTEKAKPASGKGNVQGTVLFNDKPAANIEVKLCEEFSTMMGISCTGKTVAAKTDADGVYVLANAEPMQYQGLMAKVFASDYYVSPQEGIMTAQKFDVESDKTIFANDIHLFKSDLKVLNPKAGGKVDATNLELKWNPYGDAAYYKLNVYSESAAMPSVLSGERIEDASYTLDRTLDNGKYRISVEAYNSNDHKLAESADDIKFTVTGGNAPATEN